MFAGIVSMLMILKQLLLDTAAMLCGNVTGVLGTTTTLMGELAGLLKDVYVVLEKVILLLTS